MWHHKQYLDKFNFIIFVNTVSILCINCELSCSIQVKPLKNNYHIRLCYLLIALVVGDIGAIYTVT